MKWIAKKGASKSGMKEKSKYIFDGYIRLAKTLVGMFGRNCEVAIHDFELLPNSLVHIEGSVTGRSAGAPITDLVVRMLKRYGNDVPELVNYSTTTRDGRVLKSSTSFIRDAKGVVIGAFCINFDTSQFMNMQAAIKEFVQTMNFGNGKETFVSSFSETVESLIKDATTKMGKLPSAMTKDERVSFVGLLEEQGAFLIKGAVEQIARFMGVSKYSVYNYLKEVRLEKENVIKQPSSID